MTTDRLQRPLRDMRISVMDRCNLRCTYCMPEDVFHSDYTFLPRAKLLTYEEITRVAEAAISLGVRKIRLTGGEPLLRRHLVRLVEMLRALDPHLDLALTTNGILLADQAAGLRNAGLNRITVSLDAVDTTVLESMAGKPLALETVLNGIRAAEKAGFPPVKINMMVQKGVNDHQILPMLDQFAGTDIQLRFIEYMDVGATNQWDASQVMTGSEILDAIRAAHSVEHSGRKTPHDVAEELVIRRKDGLRQVIGIITSVSKPFCGDCSRLRLSAIGECFTCLFAEKGIPLREGIRGGWSDTELANQIAQTWTRRTDRYSEERGRLHPIQTKRVEMSYIGG